MWINTFRTQGDMLWVAGDRKWTFKIPTVTIIDSETKNRRKNIKSFSFVFKNIISKIIFLGIKVNLELYLPNIMVNSKYFPSNGTAKEVGGIISANSKKNTVRESNMEIQSVTWNFNWTISYVLGHSKVIYCSILTTGRVQLVCLLGLLDGHYRQ